MRSLVLKHHHPWDVPPRDAIRIQQELREYIIVSDTINAVRYVAGVDVGFEAQGKITRAAVVVLEFPSLKMHESSIARKSTSFPYIPGLLSFRELPAVLEALQQLKQLPDLILCDGQGYAHPRRLGIACHLGVLTDIPAIGVGKTRLIGSHKEVKDERGDWQPLLEGEEVVGAVLRTRQGVKPIYISIGHRINLTTALDYVMACTPRYKLPETTRLAHKFASNH